MAVPLMSMVVGGHAEGRLDIAMWPLEMIVAAAPDVVVFQRYMEDNHVAAMTAIREALPDALLVYELDDFLGEIPEASFHRGFMPPGIPARIARAAKLCDRVTTSTEPLAAWFRDELGCVDVRTVANAIPAMALRPRVMRSEGRLRIGFVGGISHDGDLELIRPAMEAIGEDVEWVFFGTQPKNPPVRTEFHPGVPAHEYQLKMLQLDLDLVLAPLESNRFNECKSNLRLIEGGMVGACVIAQRATSYTDGDPPVFAYAETAQDWIAAIRAFMAAPSIERQVNADALLAWVRKNHTLEKRIDARLDAWLPGNRATDIRWKVGRAGKREEDVVVSLPLDAGDMPRCVRNAPRKSSLIEACRRAAPTGADVLWLRPGTALDDDSWRSMRSAISQTDDVASAIPLASDGPNAFPRLDTWTQISADTAAAMAAAVRADMPGRRLIVGTPLGPCSLLSARALAAIGWPDVDGCGGNEEQSIMEWGLRAAARGFRNMQAADAYAASVVPSMPPTQGGVQRMHLRGYLGQNGIAGEMLTERERSDIELAFLRLQWAGPQPGTAGFGHDYASWAMLKGDLPEPKTRSTEWEFVSMREFGVGIESVDSNWVVFTDGSVTWKQNGFATLIAACADADDVVCAIYADNDIGDGKGGVYPDLKPDFDLELFLARDYVTPVCAVRTRYLTQVSSRVDLYGFLLHAAEHFGHPQQVIRHLPKTVATVREPEPEDVAMYTLARQMAIESFYAAGVAVTANPTLPGTLSVVRNRAFPEDHPLVSIIVPTLGKGRLIQPCVNTVRQHTAYPNYEIIVVQNGPLSEPELGSNALADPRVRVVRWEAQDGVFDWSRLCNDVVRNHALGSYLLFLNDDVCVGAANWLDAMMGHAVRPDVGAVGAKLVHPAGVVQHVGVVAHQGIAGHLFKGMAHGNPGNGWLAALTHEAQAVTGACMLVSRVKFDAVGGFDAEAFPMNYGDTDFCLRLRRRGLRNVVEMTAELLHPEGTSRTDPANAQADFARLRKDNARFAERWKDPDPYWHPDLAIGLAQGGMAISGLHRELLSWNERRPAADARRVLTINDLPGPAGRAVALAHGGETVFAADMSGFALRLTAPIPANAKEWDIRDPDRLALDLGRLGIDRVVLRSLVGSQGAAAPAEALRCLYRTGLDVEMDPIDGTTMTPWDIDGVSERNRVTERFGVVDLRSWREAYEALLPVKEAAD
jgi:GT2 family glycosyltransferase